MCHWGSDDQGSMHRVKADGHSLSHTAGPVVDKENDRSLVCERSTWSDLLKPVPLYVSLAVMGDSMALIRQHLCDESPHDSERNGTVSTTGHIAEVENQAAC